MAATASPRAAVEYLQKALEINPDSSRAKAGMQWALKRQAQFDQDQSSQQSISKNELLQTNEILQQKQDAELKQELTAEIEAIAFSHQPITTQVDETSSISTEIQFPNIPERDLTHQRISILPWILILFFLCIGLVGLF